MLWVTTTYPSMLKRWRSSALSLRRFFPPSCAVGRWDRGPPEWPFITLFRIGPWAVEFEDPETPCVIFCQLCGAAQHNDDEWCGTCEGERERGSTKWRGPKHLRGATYTVKPLPLEHP